MTTRELSHRARATLYVLRHPGRQKRIRWQTALHEAGHAVAYSFLCGQSSRASVNRDGTGECLHSRVVADLHADSICIASGEAAEIWAFYPMPAAKPRGTRRRPVKRAGRSDAENLRLLSRLDQSELKVYGVRTNLPALGVIQDQAADFVHEHLDRILAVARVIFRRGVAFVPAVKAKLENRPAGACLPGHITTVAASAAKGSHESL